MSVETAAERFLRIGTPRLEKALDALSKYSKTIERGSPHYEWTKEQASEIVNSIEERFSEIKSAFGLEDDKIPPVDEKVEWENKCPDSLNRSNIAWAYDKIKTGFIDEGGQILFNELNRTKKGVD
jgi:folate-binding Fe-S cluster repair protein YgfZ